MPSTAREIMSGGVDCIGENETVAEGKDANSCRAGELAQGKPVTIGADDSLEELVRTMGQHQVKRVPVIDGHRLVGIVSESDVAGAAPQQLIVDLVKGVYSGS